MAVNPGEKRYAEVSLEVNNSLGTGSRTVTATCPGGAYPGANVPSGTTSITLSVSEATAGLAPPVGGFWGIAVVRDNSDPTPNYTVTGNVLAYTAIGGTGGTLSTSVNVSVPERGTFRLVLVTGDTAARAQNGSAVNTGGTSAEYHRNSDAAANGSRGGLAQVGTTATAVAGYNWRNTVLASRSYSTAGNLRYGHTSTVTVGFAAGTYINPKPIKVGLRTASADGTMQDGIYRPTLNTSGAGTTSAFQVDTDFTAAPTDYYLHFALGAAMGESIPAAERPDLLTSGTITGTTADQRHWLQFDTSGHLAGFTGSAVNRIVSTATDKQISSAVNLKSAANGSTDGALTYNESGRTNLNKLFLRRQSASLDGPHGHVYYRAWAYDGYGNALPSGVAFNLATLDSDGTSENSQNITTGTAGVLNWDFQVGPSVKAFSRFTRTSPDNPDSLGTHDIAIATASVYKPAGTKTTTYPDPKSPTTTRDFSAATFPARAKDVRLTGNVFGSKEPTDTEADQWGCSSEIIYAGMWSGNTSDTTYDANGAPTGAVARSKVTAAGSYAFKLSSKIDEDAFSVADLAAHNGTDVAGRPFSYVSGFFFTGQRGVFDRTNAAVDDAGSILGTKTNQATPIGYSTDTPANQTFDTLAAPSDATTYGYYMGYSNLSATRNSFGLTAGVTEIPGFTTDNGLFGYRLQVIEYNIIRDDLAAVLANSPGLVSPGQEVVFKAKAQQILPDQSAIDKTFDGPPTIYIYTTNGLGTPLTLTHVADMTAIGAPPTGDYEYGYTPANPDPGERETFVANVFSKIDGSRARSNAASFTTGAAGLGVDIIVDILKDDSDAFGGHIIPGEGFILSVYAADDTTGDLVVIDSSPAPAAALTRATIAGDVETYNGTSWVQVAGAQKVIFNDMTLVGDTWQYPYTLPVGDARDFVGNVRVTIGGARYFGEIFREVLGTANAHNDNVSISVTAGNLAAPGTHVKVGDEVSFGAALEDSTSKIQYDADSMEVAIRRFRSDLGTVEHWNGSAWVTGDTFTYLAMTPSPGDAKLAIYTLPGSANDGTGDLITRVKGSFTPAGSLATRTYTGNTQVSIVDDKFQHDAVNEDSIPYDSVDGHHHIGTDSRAIGGRGLI